MSVESIYYAEHCSLYLNKKTDKSQAVISPSAAYTEAHRKEKTSITLVFSGAKTIVNWEGN